MPRLSDLLVCLLLLMLPAVAHAQVPPCEGVDPAAFDAIPSDGKDDRAALQAAWDSACSLQQPLCLKPGRYDVTRRQAAGASNIGSLKLTCAGAGYTTSCTDINGDPLVGMEVAGHGMTKTVISLMGDGTFPGSSGASAWSLVQPQQIDGLCFRDVALVGDRRVQPTNDQTHLFEVLGPSDNISVERVAAWLPQFPEDPTNDQGGDCMRSVGTDVNDVNGFVIRDSVIGPCYRCAAIFQRGSHDVLLENSWFKAERNKQSMDMESSAGGHVYNLTIRDSVFTRTAGQTGPTIALDGVAVAEAITNILFEDSVIEHGGIVIDDVVDATFRRVTINSGASQSPTVQILKHIVNLLFEDVTITRPSGAPDGDLVKIYEQEGRTPTNVRFLRSVLRTDALSSVIYGEGVEELRLEDSTLEYAGPAASATMIKLRGLTATGDPVYTLLKNVVASPGSMDGLLEWVVFASGGTPEIMRAKVFGVPVSWPLFTLTSGTSNPPLFIDNYIRP